MTVTERKIKNMVNIHVIRDVTELMNHLFEIGEEIDFVNNYFETEDGEIVDYKEPVNYFIVSDWLAKKLDEQGEMICYDCHGLIVWGRETFGQLIECDYIIKEIAKEVM